MPEENHTGARAVVLFSGGLDSTLAAEVLRRAGVDVILLRHTSIFYPLRKGTYVPPCPMIVRDISETMARLVADPKYGHGRNANPCLDCKQMMYGLAWQEAQRQGADFIATGEVLGQRPMSQNPEAFARMEKGAGVKGLVVRPLSGRLLPLTVPEEKGLIRREDLLDFSGRGRHGQMALAARWGITSYAQPAGGCRLTTPQYAERVFALARMGFHDVASLALVRHGRLFALEGRAFVVVGRDEADDEAVLADAPAGSLLLELRDRPGPLACLVGEASEGALTEARRLVVRYSRFRDLPREEVAVTQKDTP
jgi:tRNA-specific 2-thiouridylase